MGRVLGLSASVLLVGAAIVACRPTGDIGYVEIKTVPVAAIPQTELYLDSTKLAPISKGDTILRQSVGTLRLQVGGFGGALTSLCRIVVLKDRITTVTLSVLERPPRCVCRYTGVDGATAHQCVS
jgi:hypothetical protein